MKLTTAYACCLLALVTLSQSARGNNNFFMPGDAFFPTSCTQQELEEMTQRPLGQLAFQYDSFGSWPGAFCGNAGFTSASFVDLNEAFLKNIENAYAKIREEYPKEMVKTDDDSEAETEEANPIRILFYRRDFPYKQKKINKSDPTVYLGLRYNEDWADETVKFGHRKDRIRMCPMIPDHNAITESWRDAVSVAPLDVEIPENFDYRTGLRSETETPVKITGKIKAVMIPAKPLLDYYKMDSPICVRPNRQINLVAYVVDSSGIERIDYSHTPRNSK